jgi:cytochrome-b5 reductase
MLRALALFAERQPDRFKMRLFVDSRDGPPNISLEDQKLQIGRIGKSAIMHTLALGSWWQRLGKPTGMSNSTKLDRKILFLVCGPDQ